jgi:hypothetical protein
MAVTGEQSVALSYTLAVIGKRSGVPAEANLAILLVGQIDRAFRFAVVVARFSTEEGREAAYHASAELEDCLRMHVEPVLATSGPETTLSAPVQALHYALRSSGLAVNSIRPERSVQVRLCDARGTAREIARQHLLLSQGVTSEQDSGAFVPLVVDLGPFAAETASP